ncbi:amidase [Paenactinomyces guangxiensis]|uniref:Amidase n=2 Tax=Paenactinomyces guangxiensis TaxID=1490290 RepID=A0A7W2A7N3_9BACL|nr:amidase [Paenactinomyces guangxiensis]MBA4492963.1 amidase [Paenactinomyces guangxiensis]MBH8590188.1 amidase [Paenactinomyces guangxiensis]
MDATTLATKIQNGEVTPIEATGAYIKHIHRVNPRLNALIQPRFQQAKQEAKQLYQQYLAGNGSGRLFGVPVSIKESFYVKGMKTTGGLPSRRNHVDEQDAEAVRRLKAEGAIILGKTNTPSLCFCQETDNTVYGRTNNPWNLERTAGGSSGGEGVLIAVGGAAVGIGADIGGSIRFPAHFNGVIGFKSGKKQVSSEGCFPPLREPLQENMLGIGALAKSVNDAELVHNIIADRPTPPVDIKQFQFLIPPAHPALPMQPETAETIDQIRSHLSETYIVHNDLPPFLEESALMWQLIMSVDGGKALMNLAGRRGFATILYEFLKSRIGLKPNLHFYLTWALLGANLFKPSPAQWQQMLAELEQAEQVVDQYLRNRVLILPVYHSAAPKHGKLYSEIFSIRRTFLKFMPYISYANTFGLPVLTVPVATDQGGLPIGIQLITALGQEYALFRVGKYFEQQFRGYVRCSAYD